MFFTDLFIKGREMLVNGFVGTDLRKTMNPAGTVIGPVPVDHNLIAEIMKRINQFKAITNTG